MLKGRWRLIYKTCECKLYNIRYVIMAAVVLHNICIYRNDPCKPRWKLKVSNFELQNFATQREEGRHSKQESYEVSRKIMDWLWDT